MRLAPVRDIQAVVREIHTYASAVAPESIAMQGGPARDGQLAENILERRRVIAGLRQFLSGCAALRAPVIKGRDHRIIIIEADRSGAALLQVRKAQQPLALGKMHGAGEGIRHMVAVTGRVSARERRDGHRGERQARRRTGVAAAGLDEEPAGGDPFGAGQIDLSRALEYVDEFAEVFHTAPSFIYKFFFILSQRGGSFNTLRQFVRNKKYTDV